MTTRLLVALIVMSVAPNLAAADGRPLVATGDAFPGGTIVGRPTYPTVIGFFDDGALLLHSSRSDGGESIFAVAADGATTELMAFEPDSHEEILPDSVAISGSGNLLVTTSEYGRERLYRVDASGVQLLAESSTTLADGSYLCRIERGRNRSWINSHGDAAFRVETASSAHRCGHEEGDALLTDVAGVLTRVPYTRETGGESRWLTPVAFTDDGDFIARGWRDLYKITTTGVQRLFGLDDIAGHLSHDAYDPARFRIEVAAANSRGDVAVVVRTRWAIEPLLGSYFPQPGALAIWRDGSLEVRIEYAGADTFDPILSLDPQGDVLLVSGLGSLYFPTEGLAMTLNGGGRIGPSGEVAFIWRSQGGELAIPVRDRVGQITYRRLAVDARFASRGVEAACVDAAGRVASLLTRSDGTTGLACIDDLGIHPVVDEGSKAISDAPLGMITKCHFAPDGALLFLANESTCSAHGRAIFRVTEHTIERIVGRGDRTISGEPIQHLEADFAVEDDGTIRFSDYNREAVRHPDGTIERAAGRGTTNGSTTDLCRSDRPPNIFASPLESLPAELPTDWSEDDAPRTRATRHHHSPWAITPAGEYTVTQSFVRDRQTLYLNGPARTARCDFITPAAEYPTRTPTPRPTWTRRPTHTPRPTRSATPTPTATPDACRAPGACTRLRLRSQQTAGGYWVSVGIDAGGPQAVAVQADLQLPSGDATTSDAVMCKVNPFVRKPLRYWMVPGGVPCDTGRCAVVRVLLVALEGTEPLPDVEQLFTCRVRTPPEFRLESGASISALRAAAATQTGARVAVPPARIEIGRR